MAYLDRHGEHDVPVRVQEVELGKHTPTHLLSAEVGKGDLDLKKLYIYRYTYIHTYRISVLACLDTLTKAGAPASPKYPFMGRT